jgi:lipopolysaccharide/colanic/teichoic acid biosynthesis glycosyltransferase
VVRVPYPIADTGAAESRVEDLDGMRVETLVVSTHRSLALVMKRTLDMALAAGGLVLLSPLFALITLGIAATDGRPILFRQTRVGRHGRPFTILKFRTMTRDAEARLGEVMHLNQRTGAAFKADDDPRCTPLGRFLRRTSLDELPQLWNVLLGQMSLVGPRPPLPGEVDRYDNWHRRRLSMKPGITGLWQIHARSEPLFDRWVEWDLRYIDQWSLGLDLSILLRTLPALLRREGQ